MMKKTARLLALAALLTFLPAMALAWDFAVVRGGRLNLRAQMSTASRSLGLYGTGSWVRVDGGPTNGWYAVTAMDGKEGYMSASYLSFGSGANAATVRYANGGYVNMRSGPSMDASVIMRVTSGTPVNLKGTYGEWEMISIPVGTTWISGYMLGAFLDTSSSAATVTTRNGGKVNVRTGPSSRYGSVGSLPSGTRVNVLLKGDGWYKIAGGGLTGYMSTTYLSGTGVTAGSNTGSSGGGTTTSQVAYVNNPRSTQVLNLRQTPSQSAKSIGQYRNGTQVKVVSYGASWCEVYVGTRHGYMMTRYLSFDGSYVQQPVPVIPQATATVPVIPQATATIPVIPQITASPTLVPVVAATPEAGRAVTLIVNVGEANAIGVYNDASMVSLQTTVTSGTQATMLTYGETACMILLADGHVGYVPTRYVAY